MKQKPPKQPERAPEWTGRSLELRIYPDSVLREICRPVGQFDSSLRDFADEMHTLMLRHQGVGLAAPQVGIQRRVIVADVGDGPVFVVNPEILEHTGSSILTEGCLSLPGTRIDIQRALGIEIMGWSPMGEALRFRSHGMFARVLQHEIDHLNGVLIIDHAQPLTPLAKREPTDSNERNPYYEIRL